MRSRLPSWFVNAEPIASGHDREWFVAHLLVDVERMATAVRSGALGAEVAACPGWDLRQLAAHVGTVQRWARHSAAHAAPPESFSSFAPDPALDAEQLAAWLEEGAGELVATLRTLDPQAPTWHPFPVPRVGWVWPRRQAHEMSIHRWDAELAASGTPHAIDPELASDGIDEYLELVVPRLVKRDGVTLPTGSLHLHCTDTHGEWLVSSDADGYRVVRAHQKGDAAIRGPAEALLLRLWNRDGQRSDELSPVGDDSVLDAWLALSGL